jgi:tryptophan 2,3-dioxygenase
VSLAEDLPRLAAGAFPGLAETAGEYQARLSAFGARWDAFTAATLRPAAGAPTYAEWLRLDALLSLQEGVKSAWCEPGGAPEGFWKPEQVSPDENMFIIVHQCFEVYFKVCLDLIDRALPALQAGRVDEATRRLRRAVLIQRLLVPQIQMPATMLPLDFMRFRDQRVTRDGRTVWTGLTPASGTESYQFREIEIVCGLRDDPVFRKYLAGTDKLPIRLLTPRQRERLEGPTLPEAFDQAVRARGVARYDDLFTPADAPNPHLDLALLADTLLEFDQFFHFWRVGHLSMVEKMIGNRSGTGFLGPEYLAETTGLRVQSKNRVFDDSQVRPRFFEPLWHVRTRLMR